jgi:hypothetical protein
MDPDIDQDNKSETTTESSRLNLKVDQDMDPDNNGGSTAESSRFSDSISETELDRRIRESTPENTRKKMLWAVRIFREWMDWKIQRQSTMASSSNQLLVYKAIDEMTKDDLNYMLQLFIFDAKKKSGEVYPPKSLYDIYAMLNYYVQNELHRPWSLFKDSEFLIARRALEARMKEISKTGLISGTRKAQYISLEYEKVLWSSGTLGSKSPVQLLNTVVYLIGLHFCLRGGEELRRMRHDNHSQIIESVDAQGTACLIYNEDISKTKQGGLKTIGQAPKKTYAYHNNDNHEQCLPCLFQLYISKRPPHCTTDALFLTPIQCPGTGGQWYKNMALGKNSLLNIVKVIMSAFDGRFTNHSLRRTSATRLFQSGIPEDIIRNQTGHRSNVLSRYKECSTAQLQNVSATLYPPCTKQAATENAALPCHNDEVAVVMKNSFESGPVEYLENQGDLVALPQLKEEQPVVMKNPYESIPMDNLENHGHLIALPHLISEKTVDRVENQGTHRK